MKRSLTLTLMAIAGTAILAVALIGFRMSQGGLDYSAYAHIYDINGDTTIDSGDAHVEIDMVQDGVSTDGKPVWCAPVDTTATHAQFSTYQVAVCLTSAAKAPFSFNMNIVYDDSLNECVPVTCEGANCLDSDPDANVGTTFFGNSTAAAATSLGTGWNCNLQSLAPPVCDTNTGTHGPGAGVAFLQCAAIGGTGTLPIGTNVSAPMAVLTFHALLTGVDTINLDITDVYDNQAVEINGDGCTISGGGPCFGATDIKATPLPATDTPTPPPTNTPVPPTATNTPVPGVRMEKVPALANLWLMKTCVDPALGKGCLEIDEWIYGIADVDDPNDADDLPEGLGAWENQIRFDHKFISVTKIPDSTWLFSGGRWGGPPVPNPTPGLPDLVNGCFIMIQNENSILEGCISKDDPNTPGIQLGPEGQGLIERIIIVPNINDLVYRSDFRPTKDNGILIDLVDDNCEVTDIYGEQIPGTLPGQLTTVCGDAHITLRFLECDLDLDCEVNVTDDQAEAFRYGSQLGLQLYDRWYDMEPKWSDDDIDIKDLQFCFGRNYSTCENPIPDDQGTPVPPHDP